MEWECVDIWMDGLMPNYVYRKVEVPKILLEQTGVSEGTLE